VAVGITAAVSFLYCCTHSVLFFIVVGRLIQNIC
jgi:hypothetical protein